MSDAIPYVSDAIPYMSDAITYVSDVTLCIWCNSLYSWHNVPWIWCNPIGKWSNKLWQVLASSSKQMQCPPGRFRLILNCFRRSKYSSMGKTHSSRCFKIILAMMSCVIYSNTQMVKIFIRPHWSWGSQTRLNTKPGQSSTPLLEATSCRTETIQSYTWTTAP